MVAVGHQFGSLQAARHRPLIAGQSRANQSLISQLIEGTVRSPVSAQGNPWEEEKKKKKKRKKIEKKI